MSGKGGVGKTTLATAAALRCAAAGARTLLVSTDPAHSTGDILGVPLGPEPTPVRAGLEALEIDPLQAATAHLAEVESAVADRVDPDLWPQVRRHLRLARDSPGMAESATFERVAGLFERCPAEYDRLVVDTAPTGHTLRLLALPGLLQAWVEGLAHQRKRVTHAQRMWDAVAGEDTDDPVLTRLRERRDRLRRAAQRLRHDTAVWLVLEAARLSIEETARAEAQLAEFDIPVAGLLVNRVLPPEADGDFLARRREQQRAYLDEITTRFEGRIRAQVPQLPTDPAGLDDLSRLGAWLDVVTPAMAGGTGPATPPR